MDINGLKKTARAILAKYRQNLINNHPFIGTIAMNLDLVPIRDARCSTAMTDGKSIYFDIDFLSKLNEKEGVFVLGHEVWHVVMMHFLRGKGFDPSIFNIACDMEVNQILENDGFIPPADVIFPNKQHSRVCQYDFPDGLNAEKYYELLLKDLEKSQNKMNREENAEKSNSKRNKNKNNNGGNCSGQFDDHFDKNVDYDKAGEDALKKKVSDKYGEKGLDEDFKPGKIKSESVAKEMAEEIRQSIVSAAQTYEKLRGELPGHIKKIVNTLLESKVSWKEALAKFITSGMHNKSTWNAPNRRFAYNGIYLPRHDGDMMRIAIGIDTSGSCQDECQTFLSEINEIAKTFGNYELHLIQCDTQVQDYQTFDEFNTIEGQVEKMEFKGFGGTTLKPIFDYIQLNNIEVNGVVVFTDGYCEDFEDDGSIDLPVLWTITGDNKAENLKVGEKIYIK